MTLDLEAERALVERLRRRDEAAFNLFVRSYQAKVFSLVQRMLGNRAEAEDLAQIAGVAGVMLGGKGMHRADLAGAQGLEGVLLSGRIPGRH